MKENLIKRSVNKKAHSGFTLIEMLIVVLIIGILAAIALPQYRIAVEKTKVSKYLPFIATAYDALQRYYLINNRYPASFSSNYLDITVPTLVKASYYYFPSYGTFAIIDNTNDIRVGKAYTSTVFPKGLLFCYYMNGDNVLPAKIKSRICASVCGHDNMVTVFNASHRGCVAGYPDFAGM